MAKHTPQDRLQSLAATVNASVWLTRIGRHCTMTFVLQIGDDEFYIRVAAGIITDVRRGAFLLRSYAFAIRGPQASWAEFWQARPRRGFHDLFAMTTYGHVQVDGDLDPLRKHLPFVKGVLAAMRDAQGAAL